MTPTRLLLQGCPISVLAAIAEQHVWAGYVKAETNADGRLPRIQLGAYIDDRTLWCTGKGAARRLQHALEKAKDFDDAAKWRWNDTKGSMWAMGDGLKAEVGAITPAVGQVKDNLELLGVTLPIAATDAKRTRIRAEIRKAPQAKVERQCQRINIACSTTTARAHHKRRRLVQQLIVPKASWGGQFQAPTPATVRHLDIVVERTVNGNTWFRSPALAPIPKSTKRK